MVKIDRYGPGKWNVKTADAYPRRVGHITGARGKYLAEMGPDGTLGYFKTLKSAANAIDERAKEIETNPQAEPIPADR